MVQAKEVTHVFTIVRCVALRSGVINAKQVSFTRVKSCVVALLQQDFFGLFFKLLV
jgi:hypothetical protein